jgi:outer membrane protein insertion porin family
MVPASALAESTSVATPETPGANGFELVPASAPQSGAPSSATAAATAVSAAFSASDPAAKAVSAPAMVTDASGFEMVAAPQAPAAPQVVVSSQERMQLSPPTAMAALTGQSRLSAVSGEAPSLVAEAAATAPQATVLMASARQVHPSAPDVIPVVASGRIAPVAGTAPVMFAEAEALPAARLVLYPDFVMDVRPDAPTLVPAYAHLDLVAAPPSATMFVIPAVALSNEPALQLQAPASPELFGPLAATGVSHAQAPSLVLVAASADDEARVAVAARTALAVQPVQAVSLTGQGARAEVLSASAPQLWAQSEATSEPVHVLALAPVKTVRDAAPEIEHFSAPSHLARVIPAAFVEPVASGSMAEENAAKVHISRADRLELDVRSKAHLAAAPKLDLVAYVPEAVAQTAAEPAQAAPRSIAVRSTPLVMAAEAPIATAPALELPRTSPDLSLAPWTANAAASAQSQALPVSAAVQVARSNAERSEPGVITLAQADPAPAVAVPPPPPSAPAIAVPPPAAEPAAVPAPSAPAAPEPTSAAPAASAPVVTAPAPAPVVQRIIVQGNERIEPSTILSYLPIQVGDTVDAAKIDMAVKTLFRTDLFADVSMEMQGSDLVVKVSENPIINEVVFEGNHALKEDKLRDEVSVRPRGIFTRSKVDQDAQKIIELYRRSGRISATVTPKIVQLPQKRVDLIFEINEGPKSGILHINFVGNKSFSDSALSDVIVTRESHWYKFFQSNDNYDPDRIEYDREQLRKFYRNHGYYDFRVISGVAELAPDKNGFVVTFTVDEGPRYHFGKVKVETELKRLNGELLQALLPIHSGQLYEDDRIEKATDALTYAAGANGFAFVDVRPRYVAHPETRTVDVTFDIKEGPRVYVERIDVVGNTQTLDYVIRREMRVAEGDAYNRVLVDRSKQQIKSLGFFKDVDIEQLPGSSPDKTVLRVKVTEQPTGQLTFSIGYSSLEKLVGDIGISQSNFRGRGQTVDFQVSMGYLEKRVSLSFTEPRFQGRNMAAGFDLYTYNYNYATTASFTSSSTGVTLRTGFPINQYSSLSLRYAIHSDSVSVPSYVLDPNTHQCSTGYSQSLCDEVGTTFTSALGYTLRLDRRNDPILPTRGFYMQFSQDFAGLGGVRYIKTFGDAAWYYGFTPKWIMSVSGKAGYITGWGGDTVRINDRFFEGGDTFRGFQIAGIGPRDNTLLATGQCGSAGVTNVNSTTAGCYGSALGAKAYAIGSIELQVPNPIPAQYGIKTALFTDFGTAGLLDAATKRNPDGTINPYIRDNLAFRATAGVSVFWKSPMGPLRFDFSKILKKAPYDVQETFYFSTTTAFQ